MRLSLYKFCSSASSRVYGSRLKTQWWTDEEALKYLERFNLDGKAVIKSKHRLSRDFEVLKTQIDILNEVGADVSLKYLKKFRKIFREDLTKLENEKVIADIDVESKTLKYLEEFPYDFNLPMPSVAGIEEVYKKITQYHRKSMHIGEAVEGWPTNVKLETLRTLETAQRRVLRQYYAWRLKSDFLTIDKLMYNYKKITGLRSIQSVKKTLDILENDLEFSKEKILRNFFLLSLFPTRLQEVITNVDKIGRTDLKTTAHTVPKILAKTSAHIKEIDQTLEEYGIIDTSYYRYQVFTFSAKTVRQRLESIKNSNLAIFLRHPRLCFVLYYFNKTWTRSRELEARGLKCCSLNVLTGSKDVFQGYLDNGVSRLHNLKDVNYLISQSLNVPMCAFSKVIGRHPLRYYIPLSEVQLTLEALLEAGFATELITESVTILLYPKDKVLGALEIIANSEELKDFGFEKGFSPPTDTFTSGSKHHDKRLPLCLYLLEKPYHFTGEGATRMNENENVKEME